jgi:hypothetical protein
VAEHAITSMCLPPFLNEWAIPQSGDIDKKQSTCQHHGSEMPHRETCVTIAKRSQARADAIAAISNLAVGRASIA